MDEWAAFKDELLANPETRAAYEAGSIPCPDCDKGPFPDRDSFIRHREEEHPPTQARSVAGVGGIESQEAHGYQD